MRRRVQLGLNAGAQIGRGGGLTHHPADGSAKATLEGDELMILRVRREMGMERLGLLLSQLVIGRNPEKIRNF